MVDLCMENRGMACGNMYYGVEAGIGQCSSGIW